MARKYYKTIIQVEVLSEDPYNYIGLNELHYDITDGGCSGKTSVISSETLSGKQMAKALKEQGSDPGFFNL